MGDCSKKNENKRQDSRNRVYKKCNGVTCEYNMFVHSHSRTKPKEEKTSVFHHCASLNAKEVSSWKIHIIPATSLKFFIDSTNITEYKLQSRYNEIDVWFC